MHLSFLWYGADTPNPNPDLYAMIKKPQVHNFISLAILKSGQQTIISLHFWSQSSSCRTLNWVSLTNFCLPRQITLVWLQRWGAEGFVSNLVFDDFYLLSLVSDDLYLPSATMTKGSQELPWIVDTWVIQLAWVSRQLQTISIEKMAKYCPQGSGTLRHQLWMMHGIAWYCIVLHGISLYFIVVHGIAWYCMVLHGIAWYYMVLHGIALRELHSYTL